MKTWNPRRELVAAALLILFGLAALPGLIYLVGTTIIGAYENEGGIGTFYDSIFQALTSPRATAWLLILSPYFVVQLLRAVVALRRPGSGVKQLTE